jgi:excisionase family DNA binding protein
LHQRDDFSSDDWKPKAEPNEQQACVARQAERRDRYKHMMQWYEQGLSTQDMARRLGVTTRTIQHWIQKGIPYEKPRRKRRSCFDPYADAAIALVQNGMPSSLQIWHALRAQGFKGSYRVVPILQASPTADTLYQLVQEFLSLLRQRKGERLDAWLEKVKASQISELSRMARSFERDKAAVVAGLTLPQNNGLVEGKVNKLKLIKRMGYGRAGFALLRQRVLHAL